jgi:hypothetical protein
VAIAYGVRDEALESAVQLALNVSAIVVAGTLTLLAQRLWWSRITARAPRTADAFDVARRAARQSGWPQ